MCISNLHNVAGTHAIIDISRPETFALLFTSRRKPVIVSLYLSFILTVIPDAIGPKYLENAQGWAFTLSDATFESNYSYSMGK